MCSSRAGGDMTQSTYAVTSSSQSSQVMSSNIEALPQLIPSARITTPAPAPVPTPRLHPPPTAVAAQVERAGVQNLNQNGAVSMNATTNSNSSSAFGLGLAPGSTSTTSRSWKVQAYSREAWHAAHQQAQAQVRICRLSMSEASLVHF